MKAKGKTKGGSKMSATSAVVRKSGKVIPISKIQDGDVDLSKSTVLVTVSFSMLGNSRKIDGSKVEVDADKDMVTTLKKLIESPQLQKLNKIAGDLRTFLDVNALPFPSRSVWMVPLANLEDVDNRFTEFQEEWNEILDEFVVEYPDQCARAALKLKSNYNPKDYPAPEYVKQKFEFRYRYFEYGVPNVLNSVSKKILDRERNKARESAQESVEMVKEFQLETLAQLVGHLEDRLGEDGGRPKVFRDASVEKLNTFLEKFEKNDVTNFEELREQVRKGKALLKGISPDELRTTEGIRERVKASLGEIKKDLDTMLEERPGRKIRSMATIQ